MKILVLLQPLKVLSNLDRRNIYIIVKTHLEFNLK